jgi:glycine cleavage system H protein
VESVKAVSSIYAPVSGEITTVNEPLADDQGPLAGDPYGEGWLFKVKLGGPPPADLLDLPAYELQLEQEGGA